MASDSFIKFQKRLVLTAYYRELFGVTDSEDPKAVRAFHESLREVKEGFGAELSHVAQALIGRQACDVPAGKLETYDENLRGHTEKINRRRPSPITWKYFQHLAGLMAEHYLDHVQTDAEGLATSINAFAARKNEHRTYYKYPEVSAGDLSKIAFWMATGSGKTLLMHLNYYQYLHYFGEETDHILLVTPNEGLTVQHMQALRESDIDAVYYQDVVDGGQTIPASTIKVIEISKLVEDKTDEGVRVEVDAFEGNNLVFVDEGHKGSGSTAGTWRTLRAKLADTGFTFEYSATFGQAVSGSTPAAVQDEYGKSILFDYSYQRFYEDGYGKDYQILNLEENADQELSPGSELAAQYLLANVLTFYEQQLVFGDGDRDIQEVYHIQKPLLMFIGHSVTGGRNVSDLGTNDKRSVTDIQRLVAFVDRLLTDTDWMTSAIDELLAGTGALQIDGRDLFQGAFAAIRSKMDAGWTAEDLVSDLRGRLFHASGATGLELVDITSTGGEIGLRAGDSDRFFGVIDVGNDRGFLQLTEQDYPDIPITESTFSGSLFKEINQQGSDINVLLGSKKFIEGWSSWRVSTMGLMNIGRGEGPQIIQLFGRGVRLLGKNRSLKRSTAMPEEGPHPDALSLLETLSIFGVRAKYMATFRDYLNDEGIDTEERQTVRIETKVDDRFVGKDLQVVRVNTSRRYEDSEDLALELHGDIVPQLDLSTRVTQIDSTEEEERPSTHDEHPLRYLDERLIPILNWDRLYRSCWRYREKEGYQNLTFSKATLRKIIVERHYAVRGPESVFACHRFEDLTEIEDTVLRILRTYIATFHSNRKRSWERDRLTYDTLEENDDNITKVFEARVKRSATSFLEDLLGRLEEVESDDAMMRFRGDATLYNGEEREPPRVHFDKHLYQPLVAEEDTVVKYSPPGLNTGERQFIQNLRTALQGESGQEILGEDRETYVLRNQSRGTGVGFQTEKGGRFYPDFILWLVDDDTQHVVFVDPKGLDVGVGNLDKEPKIRFCQNIGDYETALRDRTGREDVHLHAFIFSRTSFQTMKEKQGIDTREAFAERKVYFLEEGPNDIRQMLSGVVANTD